MASQGGPLWEAGAPWYACGIGDKNTTPSGSRGAPTGVSNLPPWLSLLRVVTYIKEEIAMRKIRVSSTLTVYHDGQFWVGVFERVEDDRYSVCRVVFGAEPSNEEVLDLVCSRYNELRFTKPMAHEEMPKQAANPKRRQREASREMRQRGPSTKAQQALQEEREASAQQRKADARDKREDEKRQRFEQRQEKRKAKHRGK